MFVLSDLEKAQIITNRAYEIIKERGYDENRLWSMIHGHGVYIKSVIWNEDIKPNSFCFYVRNDLANTKIFDDLKKITFECKELGDEVCHFNYELRGSTILCGK